MDILFEIFQVFRTPLILFSGAAISIFINIYLRLKNGNYSNKSRLSQAIIMALMWLSVSLILNFLFP